MASFAVGQQIGGRYRLDAALARGGMGAVYRATDLRLNRAVAIKVLLSELAGDTTEIARFEREAIAVARLHHPSIVQVLDVGREGDAPYLVMEHVQGRTLANVLGTEGKLAWARAADIAEQALFALAVAHEAGITHRDIKPGNIMLVPTGGRELVKVLDFGIAQLKTGTNYARLTQTGAIIGTPAFMAPEQASGDTCDGRTDVYAMGVVLWCMLTGKKPFAGRDVADTIAKVLGEVPTRADRVEPSVPAALGVLCEVALQKRPADRFATAAAFATALVELRQGATTAAPTAAAVAHAAAPPATRPMIAPMTTPMVTPPAAAHTLGVAPAQRWSTMQRVGAGLAVATLTGLVSCLVGAYALERWASAAGALGSISLPAGADSTCERAFRCCQTADPGDQECNGIRLYGTMGPTGESACQQLLASYGTLAQQQGRHCE